MKLYVVIRDFLIDFDWASETMGIYDSLDKAQKICDEENAKTQKEYEKKYCIPHNKSWSSEMYYEENEDYWFVEEYILNEKKESGWL